ncbi:MAG: ATP-binding protein [Bacillota bacterium]
MADPNIWILFITALAHLTLGMLVFLKNRGGTMNRLLFGLSISAAAWSLTVLFVVMQDQYHPLLFWVRASHAAAITIPCHIFTMAFAVAGANPGQQRWARIVGLSCLVLFFLSFTPAIIRGMKLPLESKDIALGPFFPFYAAFFLGVMLAALGKLYKQLRSSRGLLRLQLRYLFWGISISLFMGSLSNMLLPLAGIKTVDLRPLGPAFSIIMVGAISYAIIKYRLMDIRLVMRNGLAITVTAFIFSVAFGLVFYLLERAELLVTTNFALVVVVLIVAFFFGSLRVKVQKFIDKYFFRGAYDYHASLLKSGKTMVSLLSLEKLINVNSKNLFEKMMLENCSFFMQSKGGKFVLAAFYCSDEGKALSRETIISRENPLVKFLKERAELLLITDFRDITPSEHRESLTRVMQDLHGEVAIPVILDNELEGILLLGPKLSGEPYSKEDENLLTVLTAQVTVAWRNAQLYQEVLAVKQHLENVLENMGNALIAVNSEGVVTLFNSAAERFAGFKAESILGRKAGDVLTNGLGDLFLQALAEKQDIKEAEQVFSRNGRELHLSCNITLVGPAASPEKGAIMVLSDVTRIKELEKEKAQALRLASLGEVAAGMAHEIKNPLVSIKTFAELLPEKFNDHEFRYTFSRIVTQEIERINALILQLLDLTADPVLFFQKTKIEDIMDEVLLLLSPYLETCNIRLTKAYAPETPPVNVDRNHIKQALFNICLNGIQAMRDGGELNIQLMPALWEEKFSGMRPAGKKEVKIVIKDTGPGIPGEIRHRIFDPFFTTKADGMGMGLSLSHKILSAHGGTIQFSSNGEGTLFEIYIPVLSE